MTLDERAKVENLARRLWPNENPEGTDCNCAGCQATDCEWDARLWGLYDALIGEELL